MVHVLFDDWLYLDIEGRPAVCGQEETTRLYKSRMKSVRAAFIDCAVKNVTEPLLESAFASDHIVQHERMGANVYQVIGALKTDIERVHRYFKPVPVVSLVPYPVALRAFLNGRGLLFKDKAVIFLDDLKTQAVLTIIEGARLTAPRRISMRDTAYMVSEIQRHQKNYISQKEEGAAPRDVAFIIVSNNREWLTAFCDHGLFTKQDIIHVDHSCPVLEGLKNAKFAMHFALPEDILKQKRRKTVRGVLKAVTVSMVMAALGFCFWALSMGHQQDMAVRLADTRQEHRRVCDELAVVDQKKFFSFLKQSAPVDYGRLYHDFISGIPRGYLIQKFRMDRVDDTRWQFVGVIYPQQDNVIARYFERSGMFRNVFLENVVVQGRWGQTIVLKEEGGHE
ncbi:MAG: hypothetical protein Q7K71_04785 [Candidatus Omnitrophota bacterium]|nr:hypothetical protein [Candidatus Omnitrophota bacterium]